MEAFLGSWKCQPEKTTGIQELGKVFGWTEEKAAMFAKLEFTMSLEKNGDGIRCVLEYPTITREFNVTEGCEFDFVGVDGTQAKGTMKVEGDKIVEHYIMPDKPAASWKIIRSIVNGDMHTDMAFDAFPDVKCVQVLAKV